MAPRTSFISRSLQDQDLLLCWKGEAAPLLAALQTSAPHLQVHAALGSGAHRLHCLVLLTHLKDLCFVYWTIFIQNCFLCEDEAKQKQRRVGSWAMIINAGFLSLSHDFKGWNLFKSSVLAAESWLQRLGLFYVWVTILKAGFCSSQVCSSVIDLCFTNCYVHPNSFQCELETCLRNVLLKRFLLSDNHCLFSTFVSFPSFG